MTEGLPDPQTLLAESGWLRGLAAELVADPHAADDLAQDAMLAALRAPRAPRTGPRAWLAGIARNLAAGAVRARLRRERRERVAARPEAQPATAETVERFALHRAVCDAVMALDEPYRTTLLLRFWEDLPPRAIAARTGVPVETVRTRTKRGIARLRTALDAGHGGRKQWAVPLIGLCAHRAAPVASPPTLAVVTVAGVAWMHAHVKILVLAVLAVAALWLGVGLLPSGPSSGGLPGEVGDPMVGVARSEGVDASAPVVRRTAMPSTEAGTADERTVTGRLVAEENGAPLAAANVALGSLRRWSGVDPGEDGVLSATDGTFAVRGGASAQELLVMARDRAPLRVRLPRGAPGDVHDLGHVAVPVGTLLRVAVTDRRGGALKAATVLNSLPSLQPFVATDECVLFAARDLGETDASGRVTAAGPVAPPSGGAWLVAVAANGLGWTRIAPTRGRATLDARITMAPTARLEVVVADDGGAPVAGARVRALPGFPPIGASRPGYDPDLGPRHDVAAIFTARTDAAGRAVLEHLPVGASNLRDHGDRYRVAIEVDGLHRQPRRTIEVVAGGTRTLRVMIDRGAAVSLAGVVRSLRGATLPGATVSVRDVDGVLCAAQAGADGHYHIDDVRLAAVGVEVSAAAPGHAPSSRVVTPEAAGESLDWSLARAYRLEGRVTDQHGAPLSAVSIYCADPGCSDLVKATADAEGRFRIEVLPEGEHRIGVAMSAEQFTAFDVMQPRRVVAGEGPVAFVLQRRDTACTVRAVVEDAASGAPLEIAAAALERLDDGDEQATWNVPRPETALGAVLAHDLVAGRWRLLVDTPGGHRGMRDFEVVAGQRAQRLRVALPAPAVVEGRVDLSGVPRGAMPETVLLRVRRVGDTPRVAPRYARVGRWRLGAGQRLDGRSIRGTAGILVLRPALDTAFRLDQALAGERLRIVAEAGGWRAVQVVEVASGGEAAVTMRLAPR